MPELDPSLIADLPPFVGMDREHLDSLLAAAKSRRYAKNTRIFSSGEPAEWFYLLLDGHIRVVRTTPKGEQVIARYISSGELFGIAEALGYDTYPADAVATVDCIALSWPSAFWRKTIEQYPTFATNTYKTVGARLQDTQDRIVEMSTERVEQRVAHAILKLVDQTGRKTDEGIAIDFPISRQDISEMTGTTLHTVSRLMSSWEQDGLVKSGRQRITITGGRELMLIANRERAKP